MKLINNNENNNDNDNDSNDNHDIQDNNNENNYDYLINEGIVNHFQRVIDVRIFITSN